jgi:hypothetical protein
VIAGQAYAAFRRLGWRLQERLELVLEDFQGVVFDQSAVDFGEALENSGVDGELLALTHERADGGIESGR